MLNINSKFENPIMLHKFFKWPNKKLKKKQKI